MKMRRKIYKTRGEKSRDFFNGFMFWILINFGLFFLVSRYSHVPLMSFLPFLLNIAGLILLAFTRSWMAFGALAAFSFALFTAALLGGATTFQNCFSYFVGGGPP